MNSVPPYLRADVDVDSFIRRHIRLRSILESYGGFSEEEASAALVSNDPETKGRPASWLRAQLAKLRKAELSDGPSKAEIADLTCAMLERCCAPHDELLCLMQELLDVDRHRTVLASRPSGAFMKAARMEAEAALRAAPRLGIHKLAKAVSVSSSTVAGWR